jgi:hypothetical protein
MKMKNIFSLKAIGLILIIFIVSCAKDENENPNQLGSYKGNWQIDENSNDFGPSTYSVIIADTSSNIQFSYLYGFNQPVYALVNGNSFNIPSQVINGSNVVGGGTLTTTTRIDMTYYVQATISHYDTIVAVLHKI